MATSRDHIPGPSLDLEELVEQYAGLLFGLARRLSGCPTDAEDLVQQTFLAAHAHGDQLRDTTKVRAWLCTILRNEFLKLVRSRRRASTISLDALGEPTSPEHSNTEIDGEAILLALDSLPEEFREAVLAKEAKIGMDKATVLMALGRPNDKIRERVDGIAQEDWLYRKVGFHVDFITFENGIVVRIRKY